MQRLKDTSPFRARRFISPFGGVWADRFNRKYIINIADGSIAFASLIVAVLIRCEGSIPRPLGQEQHTPLAAGLLIMSGFDHMGILLICAVIRSLGQGLPCDSSLM
jgi:DHA3 family macrolide efflux protein-like MFS transporter